MQIQKDHIDKIVQSQSGILFCFEERSRLIYDRFQMRTSTITTEVLAVSVFSYNILFIVLVNKLFPINLSKHDLTRPLFDLVDV